MNVLVLGLYAEGSTDYDFLPPVIRETAMQVLAQHERSGMDTLVLPLEPLKDPRKNRNKSILHAVRNAYGYHALIFHTDADDDTRDRALSERFQPACKLVDRAKGQVCKVLVPIIPVQAIEAWMLADYELLLKEIGTDMSVHDLGIPEKAKHVEQISKPKQRLEEVVRIAYAGRSRRHRKIDTRSLYKPIGEQISLERLKEVPAYRHVDDLTQSLIDIDLIPRVYPL